MSFNKKGFTLVELIIVIVIIAILAAIAAPMIKAMKARAIVSEGVAGLGTLRTALRTYQSSSGDTSMRFGWLTNNPASWSSQNLGIGPNAFTGTYFSQTSYYFHSFSGFYVYIDYGLNNLAPKAAETKKIGTYGGAIYMNLSGKIFQRGIPDSGYPEW